MIRNLVILCKVVDNYGDIGVCYRLTKAILDYIEEFPRFKDTKILLVCDNLQSFAKICTDINPENNYSVVKYKNTYFSVFNWNIDKTDDKWRINFFFEENPPHVVLECFQCGRPDWLENLLFDKAAPQSQVINLEYLTAEKYADDFHCLQSLTRSSNVKKVNFMPGFTEKTGGLIQNKDFTQLLTFSRQLGLDFPKNKRAFWILFFTYDKNLNYEIQALNKFSRYLADSRNPKPGNIIVKDTTNISSVIKSRTKIKKSFAYEAVGFVPQETFDLRLCSYDFLFVRGEDSLARACLIGKPFVWQAYPQSDNYQLVKVTALLELLKPHFIPEDFALLEKFWIIYNTPENEDKSEKEDLLYQILINYEKYLSGFKKFSEKLQKNGELTHNLLTFISKIV